MDELIARLMAKAPPGAFDEPPQPNSAVLALNAEEGKLKELNCPLCLNRGYTFATGETGGITAYECGCMPRRRSLRRVRLAGLAELVAECNFESFTTPTPWHERAKAAAMDYVENGKGSWFFIGGRSGSGKTHLCTAIAGELIERGYDLRYMLWREEAPALKALINDEPAEYARRMKELKNVPALYIDDFWKTQNVTAADVHLAFELLNARYNRPSLRTIISSEKPISEITRIDEAVGSRIYQRSHGYRLKAPDINMRLPPGGGRGESDVGRM